MNCQETKKYLSAYLDSELDPRSNIEVTEHLKRCPDCNRRFQKEQEIEQLLTKTVKQQEMPAEAWERLNFRLTQPKRFRQLRWFYWGLPLTAAAGVLLILSLNIQNPLTKEPAFLINLQKSHQAISPEITTSSNTQLTQYFRDKLNWPVPVPMIQPLTGHQTDLIGGQVDRIAGVPLVRITYRCCDEWVSVFIIRQSDWEKIGKGGLLDREITMNGLHYILEKGGGQVIWVVSKHNQGSLQHIAKNFI